MKPIARQLLNRPTLGLGVGFDLPWGREIGFEARPGGEEGISPRVEKFFERYGELFAYASFAFQPKDRSVLDAAAYWPAYDSLYHCIPPSATRVLHHTMLNVGALDNYEIEPIVEFTNALHERYNFAWIVEDLGIWSIRGKSLPYPLPPVLTEASKNRCIENAKAWSESLDAPVVVEFPGYSESLSLLMGDIDAVDFYTDVVEQADVNATLDVGHIIGWAWEANGGAGLYEAVDRLPLDRCVEIHLSGASIVKGRFRDLHHGVLMDLQLELLEVLLAKCPNLKGVTYEDPKPNATGMLSPTALKNFDPLVEMVASWHKSRTN